MNKHRIPQSTGLRKTKLFERVVGQPFQIIVPDGYRQMQEELNRPRPEVALRIRVGRDGFIKSLRLTEEGRTRDAQRAITLEHPVIVKLVSDYSLIESYSYSAQGDTIYDYARYPQEPALIQTGKTSFVVADPPPPALPAELSGIAVQPASALPLFDLLIASRKYGRGATSQADALIEWWKVAGQEKQVPPRATRLTDPAIQKKLLAYELVAEEAQEHRIIRKYRKLPAASAA